MTAESCVPDTFSISPGVCIVSLAAPNSASCTIWVILATLSSTVWIKSLPILFIFTACALSVSGWLYICSYSYLIFILDILGNTLAKLFSWKNSIHHFIFCMQQQEVISRGQPIFSSSLVIRTFIFSPPASPWPYTLKNCNGRCPFLSVLILIITNPCLCFRSERQSSLRRCCSLHLGKLNLPNHGLSLGCHFLVKRRILLNCARICSEADVEVGRKTKWTVLKSWWWGISPRILLSFILCLGNTTSLIFNCLFRKCKQLYKSPNMYQSTTWFIMSSSLI